MLRLSYPADLRRWTTRPGALKPPARGVSPGRCRRRFILLVLSQCPEKQGVTNPLRHLRPIDDRAAWSDKASRADRITRIAREELHVEVVDPAVTHGVHIRFIRLKRTWPHGSP